VRASPHRRSSPSRKSYWQIGTDQSQPERRGRPLSFGYRMMKPRCPTPKAG